MNSEIQRTRARNLQLLIEDRFGSQKSFAKQFRFRVTPTDVSLMCRGESRYPITSRDLWKTI